MQRAEESLPSYDRLMWPALLALRDLGGVGTLNEVLPKVAARERFSKAQQALMLPSGRRTILRDRVGWALSYLKLAGVLYQPRRGAYALGVRAESLSEADMPALNVLVRSRRADVVARQNAGEQTESVAEDPEVVSEEAEPPSDWREKLLKVVRAMPPSGFEKLCRSLLLATGLSDVDVTGGTGDGGIDGVGVLRIGLLSFKVVFQSKRYSGTVGPEAIRSLQAVVQGHADRGLLFTTGRFSDSAKSEAQQDGRTRIELIDGARLCELLREHKLGVSTRQVEVVEIDTEFFSGI